MIWYKYVVDKTYKDPIVIKNILKKGELHI